MINGISRPRQCTEWSRKNDEESKLEFTTISDLND